MTWLIAALLAAFINGTSAVFDKKLLTRQGLADPLAYTFWVGTLGLFALLLAPFGFVALPLSTILIAVSGGIIFAFALLAFFTALSKYHAIGFLQLVGGFTPAITLFITAFFLKSGIGTGETLGLLVLILGTFIFFRVEEHDARRGLLYLSLLAAVLFSVSDILKKIAFGQGPFLTVFIWASTGGAVVALGIILVPALRARVFASAKGSETASKALYLLNRVWASSAAIATHYALFLGHPALVEGVLSFKYVIMFVAALLILHETMPRRVLFWKLAGTIVIIFGVAWLGFVSYIKSLPPADGMQWGLTFSGKFAREVAGDKWTDMYTEILDDLGAKKLRLIAYWDLSEPEDDKFDFRDLDWQLAEARQRNAEVILAIGRKTPRWPECHIPHWVDQKNREKLETALMDYVEETVRRYKNETAVKAWQIENEPLFPFGCAPTVPTILWKEAELVRSLDPRPIILTDSGELGFAWPLLAAKSDIFGTTLYRYVHNKILGSIEYTLIPEEYFKLKKLWAENVLGKKMIIIELQGEPWPPTPMNPEIFRKVAGFARDTGINTAYWWGVEWWYKEKEEGRTEMWELAKTFFKQ